MLRKVLVTTLLIAVTACVESPTVDDERLEPVRMETTDTAVEGEWSKVRFRWGLPYLLEGETRYVDAMVIDSFGREVEDDVSIAFSTTDPDLVAVMPDGAVTGLRAGLAHVIARVDGLEGRLRVDVESSTAATLRLSVDEIEITWLDEAQIGATAYNENDRMLAASITWTSTDPQVAVIEDSTVYGVGRGETELVAVAGDARATVLVRVVSPAVASVELVEAPSSMTVGDHGQMSAVALATDGRQIDDSIVIYESLRPGVLRVEPNTGRLKALAEGAAKVVFSAGDLRGYHEIFVDPVAPD